MGDVYGLSCAGHAAGGLVLVGAVQATFGGDGQFRDLLLWGSPRTVRCWEVQKPFLWENLAGNSECGSQEGEPDSGERGAFTSSETTGAQREELLFLTTELQDAPRSRRASVPGMRAFKLRTSYHQEEVSLSLEILNTGPRAAGQALLEGTCVASTHHPLVHTSVPTPHTFSWPLLCAMPRAGGLLVLGSLLNRRGSRLTPSSQCGVMPAWAGAGGRVGGMDTGVAAFGS